MDMSGENRRRRKLGLGGNDVKRLTRNITGSNYTIYCDNYFTSATLFHDLQNKICACGTYNATRKCYPSDLKAKAKSGIGSRGSTEYRQDGKMLVILWQDMKTVLSTNCRPHSETPIYRKQRSGLRVDVP